MILPHKIQHIPAQSSNFQHIPDNSNILETSNDPFEGIETPCVIAKAIPEALRRVPQWVLWKYELRDGRITKVPYTVFGTRASVNDPDTWTDFETAWHTYTRGEYSGLGFVLTEEAGIVCVDLDHARDGDVWEPEALNIVRELNTYTEISPSGEGLHIWAFGSLPAGRRRRKEIEMYSDGRFITVTGYHFAGTPTDLQERTQQLGDLHRRIFGEPAHTLKVGTPVVLSDDELIEKAMNAENGAKFRALWNGDTTGYPSQSEADLAFCSLLAFWTDGDAERIERIFSRSALGQRDKWRTREDYRRRTIRVALQNLQDTYKGNGHGNGHTTTTTSTSSTNRPPDAVEPEKIYRHYHHLTDLLRNRYRWCPEWRTWLRWTGRVWERVPKEVVVTHAVEILRDYYMECVRNNTAEAGKWAKRLADVYGTRHVADAVDLLSGHADFLTRAEQWDADPDALNTPAGIVDLRSGQVRAHDPQALCTRITKGCPDPQARAERWERFLREIFAEDNDLIAYVQKVCATAMLGNNREQVLYILYGTGANGKSVFLNTLLWVLGDYAGNIPRDALLVQAQAHDARRTAYVSLVGVRFAVLDELEDRSRLSSTALKDLTSNNPQAARALYENYRQIQLGCTPFVGTNVKPEVTEHSLGTWRRLRLIPFTVTIPPERRDAELEAKLRAEADSIMQWLLEGLRAYWREGLAEPPAVAQATEQYRAEEDALLEWLNERTESHPRAITPAKELYQDYTRWAEDNGIPEAERLGEKAFTMQLTAHGFASGQARIGGRKMKVRKGIRLRTHTTPPTQAVVEPNGTEKHGFSKTPLRESDSAEVFQKPENSVPLGSTCVSNPPQTCVSETSTTPLGIAVRAIEVALAGGKRMSRLDLYRATGLSATVFKEAFEHMVTTGQLIADRGDYMLQEVKHEHAEA
jgi:putative DNA primase/helicase